MNNILTILFICVTLLITLNDQAAAAGDKTCVAKSFSMNPILQTNIQSISDSAEIYVFAIQASVNVAIPPEFTDQTDYKNTCLNERIFKIAKSSSSSTVLETQTLVKNSQDVQVTFKNLDYLTEYEVSAYINQTSPTTEYLVKTLRLKTCFGEPDKVKNLNVKMNGANKLTASWDAPDNKRADKICYYGIVASPVNSPKDKKEYKTNNTSFDISDCDTKIAWEIQVYANNDKECYVDLSNCDKKGSGATVFTYQPITTTTTIKTTTINGSASVFNRFEFITFVSISILLNLAANLLS